MRPILALLVLPTLACAAARPSVPPAVAEREILALEHAWDDAEAHRDVAALGAMMDDRFVFMYGAEAPIDKASVLKNVLANERPSPSTLSDLHVTVDGDVAVATGVDTADKVVDGKAVKKAYRYTSTYAHRDGRWHALSAHIVPIPPRDEVALPREADVIRWSHDAIDAWDRGDAATLGAALSEGYWDWEEGAPDGREELLAGVAKRKSPVFAEARLVERARPGARAIPHLRRGSEGAPGWQRRARGLRHGRGVLARVVSRGWRVQDRVLELACRRQRRHAVEL